MKQKPNFNLCTQCFNLFQTSNKKLKKCAACSGQTRKNKQEIINNLTYKNRFCNRCDQKFKTRMKRPKVCPSCREKPYPNIFSKA